MNPAQRVAKILLVVALCMAQSLVAYSIMNKCHVHVINGFSGTDETLEAHCKSKDDDLGLRYVPVHGEFNWTFHTDIFSRTRFSCHMWWSGGEKYLDVFWVNDKFLTEECGGNNCHWMSQNDGVYLFNDKHKEYRLKYKWEPWHKRI
ncbi:hypothetical protein HRI_003798800 [Hibiscus trionum]|uniref:S-protein homolog n=1 Tax=Hibiscus trionum TaxID=183268 RepID=A0A9W7IS49_HIBTR|nr:hypothetical protein HRI_003798800 [Hibiscus trionum]